VAIRAEVQRREPGAKLARVVPITTAGYSTAARRPARAVLDKSATWALIGPAAPWQDELGAMLGAGAKRGWGQAPR